jgi:acetyl esterase/lipase
VLVGDSAGGGLAVSLMLALRAQELPLPAGAVLMCPWIDLTGEVVREAFPEGVEAHPLEGILRSAEAYLGGHPVDDPVVSPLRTDLSGLPPLLIQTATGDHAQPESRLLAAHAQEHGVDARLEVYPADTHVLHVFWSFLPEAADALRSAGEFIHEVSGAASARGVG